MYVEQKQVAADGGEVYLRAKYNLVDLAGSEKWDLRQELSDDHVSEMTNINLSLHTLGRCISSLVDKAQGASTHVPYRESKLTRLLQDSLGGNARTFLIATVSPDRANCEETISTLKFADNAKRVMVQAVINETRPVDHALVQRLQSEVIRLRQLVQSAGINEGAGAPMAEGGGGSGSTSFITAPLEDSYDKSVALVDTENQISMLKTALEEERGRREKFEQEILALKQALKEERVNSQQMLSHAAEPIKASTYGSAGAGVFTPEDAKHAGIMLQNILTREVEVWKQADKMKRTLEKFFRFELEEEALKGKLDKLFSALSKHQDQGLRCINDVQTGANDGMTLNTLLVAAVGHALFNPAPAPAPASNPANPVAEAPPVIKKQTLFKEKKICE